MQILAVSMDNHDDTADLIQQTENYPGKLDFPLLEDKNHQTVDTYGIYNPYEESFKPGIPYPTVYIINKDGLVAHRFLNPNTGERPSNEAVREALKQVGAIH